MREIKICQPKYALIIFIFLITIPYIYPVKSWTNQYVRIFNSNEHLLFILLILVVDFLSYIIVNVFYKRGKIENLAHKEPTNFLVKTSWFMVGLSIMMNLIIGLLALQHYMSTGSFVGGREVLSKLKGINIFSQFYMLFLPVLIYSTKNDKEVKKVKKIVIILIMLNLIRAYLLPERLAVIECLLPIIILLNLNKTLKINLRKGILIGLVFISFIVLFQVFKDKEVDYSGNKASFSLALENVMMYYADTSNKLYFCIKYNFNVKNNSSIIYTLERLKYRLGLDSNDESSSKLDLNQMIDFYNARNKNMTNSGGLTNYYIDFGYFSVIVYAVHIIIFMILFKNAERGSLFSIALYPYVYLSILELPRYNYLYLTRFTIVFIAFGLVYSFNKLVIKKSY